MAPFKFKLRMLQVANVANFFMSTKSKTLINDISSHPSQSLSGTHYTSVIDNNLAIVTHQWCTMLNMRLVSYLSLGPFISILIKWHLFLFIKYMHLVTNTNMKHQRTDLVKEFQRRENKSIAIWLRESFEQQKVNNYHSHPPPPHQQKKKCYSKLKSGSFLQPVLVSFLHNFILSSMKGFSLFFIYEIIC